MSLKRNKRKKPQVPALGFSPVQATASGAGTHGGGKRQRNRRSRAQVKRQLAAYIETA